MTSGPTWEPIDAVRYLGNRSSGRMGAEIARAAVEAGHRVTLLAGPSSIEPDAHPDLEIARFQSAADLDRELRERWPDHDLLLMAAAVADYRPRTSDATDGKTRRGSDAISLVLDPVPDLLAGLADLPHPRGTRIGFALEPADHLLERAADKLARKRLHAIVANPLETMESDRIEGTLLLPDGRSTRPEGAAIGKREFAQWLVREAFRLHAARVAATAG